MISTSEEVTKAFAKNLASKLNKPATIALQGDLGAGKTTFTQGLAESLGIEKRVLSPTFVFLRSYKLLNQKFDYFHHFDLYRCQTLEDVRSTGIEEILAEKNNLVVIEWPAVAKELLPKETILIKFTKLSETEREIEVTYRRSFK